MKEIVLMKTTVKERMSWLLGLTNLVFSGVYLWFFSSRMV